MDTMKVVKRLQITAVCGLIAFALASAVSRQQAAAEPSGLALVCSTPRDETERERCLMFERQVLNATIFLRFTLRCGHNGDRSQVALVPSHATIVDSRTLLTHDHFYPLNDPACIVTALEVMTAAGNMLAEIEDVATLEDLARQLRPDLTGNSMQIRVVHFQTPLFAPVPHLTFEAIHRPASNAAFEYSGELAQINWESFPFATRVQWVRPIALEQRGDAFGLIVDGAVAIGASGGGVFRVTPVGIVHVGNIWGTWRYDNTSIVALNR